MTQLLFNQARADAIVAESGLDALVATTPYNVFYFSNYECPPHWVNTGIDIFGIYAPGSAVPASLVAPEFALEPVAESDCWINDIYSHGRYWRGPSSETAEPVEAAIGRLFSSARRAHSAIDGLVSAIEARQLTTGRIGVDEAGMTPEAWAELQRRLPNAELKPATATWSAIRAVKTAEELRRLRLAARYTEESINAALALVRPGARESDVVDAYRIELAKRGAEPTMLFLTSGARTSHPIAIRSDKTFAENDLVRYDAGCTVGHYHSDTARVRVLGKASDAARRIMDVLVQGVEKAIALVRPGADPADLYEAAVRPAREARLQNFGRGNVGHGVGITLPDPPILKQRDQLAAPGGLLANMVFTVEVAYHLPGECGFLCEDIVRVTDEGHELLTANDRSILPVGL